MITHDRPPATARDGAEKYGPGRLGWKLALAVWRSRFGKPTHQVVTLTAADLSAMKAHLTAEGGGGGGGGGEMAAADFLSTNDVIVRFPP